MSRAPSLFCGVLALFLCSRTSPAAEREARPAARQVDLIIGAPANEMQLLEAPIREMLAAKGLEVATTRKGKVTTQDVAMAIAPPQEGTPTVARVLLDFTVQGEATLLLIDPRRGRVYARRMVLANGLDAVARASVRFVIEQSIDAILEGREIGVSREEFQRSVAAPPPAAEPPHPAPAPAPVPAPAPATNQLLLAGGYEGIAMGSSEYQHAAKIVVAARFDRLQIAGAVRLAAPMSITGDGVQARLSAGGVSLSAAGRFLSLGDFSVFAGLGVGLDVTRVEPAVTTPDLQPAASFWARGPSVQPFAAIERLFGTISVAVVVGAEVHPLAERYTVRTGSEARDVFVPRRLRPTAAVLVGVVF